MLKHLIHFWTDSLEKVKRHFWLLVGYQSSQVGVQAMNFVVGILIIRSMPKDEYAAYTIMTTLVPVMLILSDTGIITGIWAIGRRVWEDNDKTGRLVSTGLQLRRRFAMICFFGVGPFLAWMLFRNHVPTVTVILLLFLSLSGISFQLTGGILNTVLGLRQKFKLLIQIGLVSTFLRLCLIAAFAVIFHLSAVLAVLAGTCATILETYIAVRVVRPQITWNAAPEPEYRVEILSLVKQTLPFTIYYCISGQLNIWLLGIFGSAHQVADIGAATRLGIIFITLTSAVGGIMVTKFARNNGRTRLLIQCIQIIGCLMVVLAALVTFVWLFPTPFVWLLGEKYTKISGLLWLVVLSTGINGISGTIFTLNTCKGWIPPAAITIPIEFVTQIVLLSFLDVSKTENVLIYSCLVAVPVSFFNGYSLIRRIMKEPE